MNPYRQLEDRFRRVALLGDAEGILHWDMSTMMPEGSANGRGEQLAVLKRAAHEILTAPETRDLLEEAGAAKADLDDWQQANLAEMRRDAIHANAVPADLVEALSKAVSSCEMEWRRARAENDFPGILPSLTTVLSLIREVAAAKAGALDCSPYDALLDEYEPGGRCADIDVLFADLGAFLPGFLERVRERQAGEPEVLIPDGPFPVTAQRELGLKLMAGAGFDFDRGRLDISLHPFCGGSTEDVRITSRYGEDDFTQGLMGVMHETGHALYEFGLPEERRYQPVGRARSMSIHESQSLLVEMQVCRSRAFLTYAAPVMAAAFAASGPAWDADNLSRLYTRVRPGFIRVDADEVTYPAHVILRYELERAMIGGDLALADLPGAWGEGMQRLLGIVPETDREGCLQDIHWFDGAWGYFPTYTLGAMSAAQIFASARACDGNIVPAIEKGDFTPLMTWLRTHIHGQGSLLSVPDLMQSATGAPLSTEPFKHHLEERYLGTG